MKLNEYLKQVIKNKGITSVRQASMRIIKPDGRPISHTTLAHILEGWHTNLDTETIVSIARFCGVPARAIFDMIDSNGELSAHEHLLSALISMSDNFGHALLDLLDASKQVNISEDDLNDIAAFIRFKVEQLKQPVNG